MRKSLLLIGFLVGLASISSVAVLAADSANDGRAANPVAKMMKKFNKRAVIGSGILGSKNGTTLTVSPKSGQPAVTVNTDTNTKFFRKFGAKSSLDELTLGDKLNVIGTWTDSTKTTIQATYVRDDSIQKRNGQFSGTVKSLLDGGFVLTPVKRVDQTVTVSSTTKLVGRKNKTIALTDIQVGDRVYVAGVWDSAANTLTEVTLVRDYSR